MDNHPIPQDVTGFQFKLVGEMTLKQFVYLAVGVIIAWIFFSTHLPAIIKLPISLISIILGVFSAFIPIEGRPFDFMIGQYLKALASPNQYVFEKGHGELAIPTTSPILATQKVADQTPIVQQVVPTSSFVNTQGPNPISSTPPLEQTITQEIQKDTQELKEELLDANKLKEDKNPSSDTKEKLDELQKKLEETLDHKHNLEEELEALHKKLAQVVNTPYVPKPAAKPATTQPPTPYSMNLDSANVVAGVVKDPRGNVLSNILVEVFDSEKNPVRAFKTNGQGKFASATALKNGSYTVSFEDPTGKNTFEPVQIEASGEIIQPLTIFSTDQREELRRALFNARPSQIPS